jgi:RuvB-like protein 1 (pontin 52)
LIQNCRKAIGIRIIENIEFYEGEVTSIKFDVKNTNNIKTILAIVVGLKTTEGSLRIKLRDSLCTYFDQSKVKVGDIIYVEPEKCILKIIGKSFSFYKENEIITHKYISTPTGKVFKKKRVIQNITLNDLDLANVQQVNQLHNKTPDISEYIHQEVDKLVSNYLVTKKAHILFGVLFIDEAHTLNFDDFCFLTKLLDSRFSPLILLSTNRSNLINLKKISDLTIPSNFINRCLIIKTKIYKKNEMANIIALKAKNNRLVLTGNVIKKLGNISIFTSLRFSILLGLTSGLISISLKEKYISSYIIVFANFIFTFYRESCIICKKANDFLTIYRIY